VYSDLRFCFPAPIRHQGSNAFVHALMAKNKMGELMSIGIDIGKDTFHIVAFDREGQLVIRKQIKCSGSDAI